MELPNFLKPKETKMARFIRSQHPNKSLAPTLQEIRAYLKMDWIGQTKINGHRLQIHIDKKSLTSFTRHGTLHTSKLSDELKASFLQYSDPDGRLVLEGEWLKSTDQIFLFDVLKYKNNSMMFSSYKERYQILKNLFIISANIKLVKVLKKDTECLKILNGDDDYIEGLVFKAWNTKGWPDTAIVRCLKPK